MVIIKYLENYYDDNQIWEYELLMKFGPTAQLSFETHIFRRIQSEILIHVRDSHAILLKECRSFAEETPDNPL